MTDIIEQRMLDAGVIVAKFPPNMTGMLQVLNLAVNETSHPFVDG